jgi:hypothetical protein
MIKPVGLHLDNSPIDQPENTARFALNAVLDTSDGDSMSYSKEQANSLSHALDTDYTLVGSIKIDGNNVILFSTNGTTSEIGLFNKSNYTTLINTPCLSFSTDHMVKGKYRIIKGCERIIYFNDNLNPDKAINIDNLDDYKDDSGEWDCNLMKLNPDFLVPTVEVTAVNNSGGSLEAGSYAFAVELLDNDLNSIAVGTVTNYIPIYADNLSDSYTSIHGSLTDINPSIEGGTSATNKSIDLELNNLDTRFAFARIIVLARNSGRGLAEEAYELLDYIPISNGTINYRFTDLSNVVRTDPETVRVKTAKYTVSSAIDIVDGRLVRANVKEDNRDYSNYQRKANEITVSYGVTLENAFDNTEQHNTKNPLSYQNGNTWIGDEVYALGIQYIFQDGTISPVFHIPGRASTSADTVSLTVGTDIPEEDAKHLNLNQEQSIPRWKYENTAGIPGQFNPNPVLGYYESDSLYPDTLDCSEEPQAIYGDLADTPIRHHKIPCRSIVPTYTVSQGQIKLQKIYLKFDGIDYPDTDIVAHRFVKAIRRDQDKTVLDTGVAARLKDEEESYIARSSFFDYFNAEAPDTINVVSPKTLNGQNVPVSYLKFIETRPTIVEQSVDTSVFTNYPGNNFALPQQLSIFSYAGNKANVSYRYRAIEISKLLSPNSVFNGDFDKTVLNEGYSNNAFVCKLNSSIDIPPSTNNYSNIPVCVLKRLASPYSNLFQLQYEPIADFNTNISYNGDGFINHFNTIDVTEIRNSANPVEVFGRYHKDMFVESDVNYELRVEGTDTNAIYNETQDLNLYILNQVATFDGESWVARAGVARQYYRYNLDYTPKSGETSQLPVPFNFDFCSNCITEYPNRVVWSPKSFSEQITDNFRINLVNDFMTVGEAKGEINAIHFEKNRLLVWTNDSIFLLTPNPRVINTDVDTAYIGTGEFLGVPAVEFSQVDHGFGGMQTRAAYVNTEQGVIWADQAAGRVYSFDSQIKELTTGIYTWMRQNLPQSGSDFDLIMSYDPYYKRVLISKKSFVPTGQLDPRDGSTVIANKSWTLSYSTRYGAWCSWHTWHPRLMFSDRDTFYSSLDNNIYRHDSTDYNMFYGIKGKFQIEYVDRQALTSDLDTIIYYASPSDYPTFNQFVVYNDNQSTGIQELAEDNLYPTQWSNIIKTVTSTQDDYRISQIRNLNTTNPTTTDEWLDIQSEYTGNQGYIDKLPANIDYEMNQWKLVPIRHKFFQIRLISNTTDQIVFHLTQTTKRHIEL